MYTVVLLVSPKSTEDDPLAATKEDDHLAAMEKIFRYLQRDSARRFLRQAESRETIIELIQEADDLHDE